MDMIINIVYATIATIIVISPFVYYKCTNKKRKILVTANPTQMSVRKKRIVVYNSPPTKIVGDKTGIFKRVK